MGVCFQRIGCFLLLSLCPPGAVSAQALSVAGEVGPGPYKAEHLTLEMIAAGPDIAAGGTQTVAFVFSLEEGWHLLWENAGDGKYPPRVSWSLPVNITAGALQFSAPDRLTTSDTVTYGYADSAAFPVTVRAGTNAQPDSNGNIPLPARLRWLVCKTECVPGEASLGLNLHLVPAGTAVEREGERVGQLGAALKGMPRALPKRFHIAANAFGNEIILTAITGTRETDAEFFPATPKMIGDSPKPPTQILPDGARVHFARPPGNAAIPQRLAGVLKLSREESYSIDVPVQRGAPTAAGGAARPWIVFSGIGIALLAVVIASSIRRRKRR